VAADQSPGLSFDTVAADYDRYRPHYPDQLFDDLAELARLEPLSQVLEIGCGTGQATHSLLERGYRVLAVDPGASLGRIARTKFSGRPFELELSTFENWAPRGRTFDLVFSSTAYHWVDHAMRWTLAAGALGPGGSIALATNLTVAGGTFHEFYDATHDAHVAYGVGGDEGPSPTRVQVIEDLASAEPDIASVWSVIEGKFTGTLAGELFERPITRWCDWRCDFDTDGAIGLLSTFSLYLAIPAVRRNELFAEMRQVIDERFGGKLTRHYLCVLAVARKREVPHGPR